MNETTIERLKKLVAGLNQLIEFLDDRPLLGEHENLYVSAYQLHIYVYGKDKTKFSQLARKLASGRKLNKEYSDYSCSVQRSFGDLVSMRVSTDRETVCQRVVTGTRIVPASTYPEHEEEIVEWKCK